MIWRCWAVRAQERCPDAVSALWKDRDAVRLDLQPLSEAEVTVLLEAVLLGGTVDGRLTSTVAARSGGNPLYCRKLVRASLAAGTLERVGGTWRLTGQMVVGQRLSELVGERVGALSDCERTAMELVALAEPIELAGLERSSASRPWRCWRTGSWWQPTAHHLRRSASLTDLRRCDPRTARRAATPAAQQPAGGRA
jgi:hypothetical protein